MKVKKKKKTQIEVSNYFLEQILILQSKLTTIKTTYPIDKN